LPGFGCTTICLHRAVPQIPSSNQVLRAALLDGEFAGMEEIKDYEAGKKWFHENSLLIKDDQAILDKVPLEIAKRRKEYSASDGGFITHRQPLLPAK